MRMAYAGGSTRLPYKASASRFVADKPGVDNLQRHSTSQIDIDRLVGHSHRAVTQLKGRSIFPGKDLVMVES
jgi:hypothetical protein